MDDKSLMDVFNTPEQTLTEWANEPSVKELKQDYNEARGAHSYQVSRIDKWLDNLNVTGDAKIGKIKGRSNVVPKLIRKQAEWRYAALSEPFLNDNDLFTIHPVSWEDKQAAQQNALVLNNQFSTKIDRVSFIDQYVRAAVNEGTVIVRVGWDFREEEQEVEVPVIQQIPVMDPVRAMQMQQQGMAPVEEVQIGVRLEKQMVTTVNKPVVQVCDYHNVVIDPTCQGDLEKASFIIFSFETQLSELEKAGIYKNLDKINVEQNSVLAEPDHTAISDESRSFMFKDKPRKKLIAYEYWGFWDIDNSGKTKPIVATWVGNTMIRMEENPFPDKQFPFVLVPYLPTRFSVYGEPDGELLEDNQKILGAVTRGMIDIMGRSANGQIGVRQDALDVTNRRKFEMGNDYEFNAHVDPKQAFFTHTYPEIPSSAQFMMQMQNIEAESITGVKAFAGGINSDSLGNVATGIRGALDAASKRELGILRRLAEGIKKVGRKIIAMNAVFLSEEEVVRITNEEFVTVRRDDLAGHFDLQLDISTAETDNAKAQELAYMLQTMGNNMPPDMSKMILADIARLRRMPDLAKQISNYQPQPDPVQQERQRLELELLKATIAEKQAEAQAIMAEIPLKGAKTNTEGAKARQISSMADTQDLNFVEQETGLKQERDLQKQGAQADANLRMKLAEHSLKQETEREKAAMKHQTEISKLSFNQPSTASQ